jgi:putative toxin-antitoxin system antitoxin component (TIGR02293 family)
MFVVILLHKYKIMEEKHIKFNPNKSIERAQNEKIIQSKWSIKLPENIYSWETKLERMALIRQRLPYVSIDVVSKRANLPVKRILHYLGVPQTTYNKKKRENNLLSSQNSETILVLMELLEYGIEVFNGETEKFHRWLKKPNISLGSDRPDSYFDSLTGIQIVRNTLNRIEHGNFA